MQEVLKRIEEVYSLLKKKESELSATVSRASEVEKETVAEKDKQVSITNALNAKIRILEKKEGELEDKLKSVNRSIDVNKDLSEIRQKELSIKEKEKKLLADREELDKIKSVFINKNQNMDALKIQLELERKLMKEKVLEELKGKL